MLLLMTFKNTPLITKSISSTSLLPVEWRLEMLPQQRVAGDEEGNGNGGKSDGNGNESGR